MKYAVCCKPCGFVIDKGIVKDSDGHITGSEPLTPKGQVPLYCPKCGNRSWRVPATEEDIEKFEAHARREARATELCRTFDIDGWMKVPDGVKGSAEVKNALSHLFAPLEGDVLKQAEVNVLKVARAGVAVDNTIWVEMYDKAVQKAIAGAKGSKAVA